ncbi:sigma-70 family RNA polymerase sigma factor [Enterocloster clostridioformis]|uniref:RNA polymerase sigma factor n=1 Tax=Enterocloster clostridioformis TaxID=1531 RepID=UPI00232AF125|nr:sigma-70 family RNA polymerase sigma factor [Enterocloster clostridioformis]MDB2132490.1 sigma-70 family RNA polymerase sigma factor [Enterocloster clostridioformis]
MDTIPRNNFILRHRYDAFCKAVLRNEAKDYLREMGQQRDREKSLDALTQQELDKLSTVDYYPSDSYVFSSHGYDLLIDNELVAEAFASLPQQEQSILILHCVLDLADGEIGSLMGMSRSAVQRHRTSTLKQLRLKLMALMPEGGKRG